MRAVLDTNVLVRATKSASGPAREVLRYFDAEQHVLVLSHFILSELLRVLAYPRVQALHGLSDAECQEYIQSLHDAAEVIVLPAVPTIPLSSDPDDDPVLQTAVHGQADVLCTLDRHFLEPAVRAVCQQHGIEILSDLELLAKLRGSQSRGNP